MGRYDVRCPRTRALGRHEPEPLVCHQCWGGAPATCGRAPRDGPRPRVDARGIDTSSKLTTLGFFRPSALSRVAAAARTTGERAGAVATPSTTLASTGPLKSQPRCGGSPTSHLSGSPALLSPSRSLASPASADSTRTGLSALGPRSFPFSYRFVHSQLLKHIHKDPTDFTSPGVVPGRSSENCLVCLQDGASLKS